MRVKHFTGEPKSRERHAAEQEPEICSAVIDLPNKGLLDKIVFEIVDPLLAGSESEFEPPQTFIGKGRPAQMQGVKSVVYTSLDSLPQESVVGSQPVKRIVRGYTLRDTVFYNDNDGSQNCWDSGGDENLRREREKLMLGILLTSEGVPLIFQGDEFGCTKADAGGDAKNTYNYERAATPKSTM